MRIAPIDYQAISYYSAPKARDGCAEEPRRSRPEAARDLRQARHPAARARPAGRRRGRCGVRQRVGRDHVQGAAGESRRDLLLVLRGRAEASRAGREVSRHGRALHRQLLRGAQLGGVHRRLVRVRAERRALPDGAVDLLPHQRSEHRPVRAHADHRRGRRARQLSRRLHGADARREPAARGRRRADRARRRADQVLDGAELVSGRRERQGRHLQLRHQARRVPRRELADLLDAGRDRLGHHLEVSELHPHAATTRSASSIRSRSRTTTSRPTPARR